MAACLAGSGGCSTAIIPPSDVKDPVTVYLVDYGRTSSIVVPLGDDGRLVRYAYGDWNWYALENNGVFDAIAALFWPTQGTLGRREFKPPANGEDPAGSVVRQAHGVEHLYPIRVERGRVRRLTERLESLYRANLDRAVEGKLTDLTFVHHPRRYTGWGNSNHQVSDWLRDLGCRIRGFAFFADWRVAVWN